MPCIPDQEHGRGCYVVIDIKEYERMVAALKLQKALADGERSAEQGGWRSAADVRKKYEVQMPSVVFSPKASEDLDEIKAYIESELNSPKAANKKILQICL